METLSYDERLARALLAGDDDDVQAAVTLFERHGPASLAEALELVTAYGTLSPEAFDRFSRAYDIHRHVSDMPGD